jgi:hypothetical protein
MSFGGGLQAFSFVFQPLLFLLRRLYFLPALKLARLFSWSHDGGS